MNDILKFLNSHASVRQFTDEAVSEEDERLIVTTAQRSPTSSNLHAWSVIAVRDQEKKDTLAELTGGQQHVSQSGVFLIWCADLFRLKTLADRRGYSFNGEYTESFIIATVDAALAACRGLMAAQALGYGGVMVGGIRNHPDKVSELVDLPELVYPVMGMSIGRPAKEARIKPRLPIEGMYFREAYQREALQPAIEQYDDTIADLGYLSGREVDPDKYPEFAGVYSWAEHTARRMATEKPTARRPHMMPFLNDRGLLKK